MSGIARASCIAVVLLTIAACSAPSLAERQRLLQHHESGVDLQCPDGGNVEATPPTSWIVLGLREPSDASRVLEIVYQRRDGSRITWCEHTREIWSRQMLALSRAEPPTHEVWNDVRRDALAREFEVLARMRLANEKARAATFVRAPSATLRVFGSPIVDVATVYPRDDDDEELVVAADDAEDPSPTLAAVPANNEIADATVALLNARGEQRLTAICRARLLLRSDDASPEHVAMVRAENKASRALLNEMRKRAPHSQELYCNDGEPSPSCTCQGNRVGNFRGCCSWHGGVSGCRSVVEEPEIECP